MNVSVTDRFTTEDAAELYGLDAWGTGYFRIDKQGHLIVVPRRASAGGIDLLEVVRELHGRGIKTPLLLRFPQLLEGQVRRLSRAFANAIEEYHYPELFQPVFPIKVNQRRPVITALLESGAECGMGLEVGSRPELMAAAAMPTSPDSLLICNGFKDDEYLSSAALAARLGKRVVVVIEKPFELDAVLRFSADTDPEVYVTSKPSSRACSTKPM